MLCLYLAVSLANGSSLTIGLSRVGLASKTRDHAHLNPLTDVSAYLCNAEGYSQNNSTVHSKIPKNAPKCLFMATLLFVNLIFHESGLCGDASLTVVCADSV